MDRRGHGPFHIGEGQPLIGDGARGELWRTSGKAAEGIGDQPPAYSPPPERA
jgi:hypothetical protein